RSGSRWDKAGARGFRAWTDVTACVLIYVRNRSSRGAYGKKRSERKQLPCRSKKSRPAAVALVSATRRDLPIPASPRSRARWPCPPLACSTSTPRATSSGVRPMIFGHKSGRLIERSIVMPSLSVFVSVHYAFFSESSHAPPRLTQRMPWFGVLVTRLTCQEKVTLSPFGWTSLTARHWGHSITVPRAVAWRSEEHTSELQS